MTAPSAKVRELTYRRDGHWCGAIEYAFDPWENESGPKPTAQNSRRGLTIHQGLVDWRAAMQSTQCSFAGCDRLTHARGLCQPHYRNAIKTGSIARIDHSGTCSFETCSRHAGVLGFCAAHLQQKRRGSELRPLREHVSAVDRFWSNVEQTESCWPWIGKTNPNGYGTLSVDGIATYAHRFSWKLVHGAIPAGRFIDHQCRNRWCVNPAHLIVATPKENQENRGPNAGSRSGVRGVSWMPQRSRWRARVTHLGTEHHLGLFDTVADAEQAAVAKRNELFTNNVLDRP